MTAEEFLAACWAFARTAWPSEWPEEIQFHMVGGKVKYLAMFTPQPQPDQQPSPSPSPTPSPKPRRP